jgi:hypothetical protein
MNRQRLGNVLIYATAALLIVSGGLHTSAFGLINAMAQSASPADARVLLPMLWIAFGVNLMVAGAIVALVALENSNGGRYVLFAASLCPLSGAVLQVAYVGFSAQVALLLLVGALAIASAIVREPRRRRSTTGA